jgi:nicotinamidase-related amidase
VSGVRTALVIIDVQLGMFTHRPPLWRGDEIVARIAGLLDRARSAGVPVFHVQHDGGEGHLLARNSAGWPHHPAVAPAGDEGVIEKRHSSAFHDTDFRSRLAATGIDRLVVTGMQTEMCVDSTCRGAAALNYRVVLASDAHTTFDSPVLPAERIIAHHNRTLGRGFAELAIGDDVRFS